MNILLVKLLSALYAWSLEHGSPELTQALDRATGCAERL